MAIADISVGIQFAGDEYQLAVAVPDSYPQENESFGVKTDGHPVPVGSVKNPNAEPDSVAVGPHQINLTHSVSRAQNLMPCDIGLLQKFKLIVQNVTCSESLGLVPPGFGKRALRSLGKTVLELLRAPPALVVEQQPLTHRGQPFHIILRIDLMFLA